MKNIDTLCVRGTYKPKSGEPNVAPIIQSTTYAYEKADDLAALFDLKAEGHIYSRLTNPTNAILEQKVALLEGGSGATACASGMSATLLSVLNVCFAGDNIVCSQQVYGGTYNLFNVTLKKYGIETRFVDPDASAEEIESLIDEHTKILFAETVANPTIVVLDFEKWASIANKHKILFYVDNTLASPALCRPKEYGANVVLHSSSKYLDGHAIALGGIVVDCGNFNFKGNPRYPEFNNPDESYHGIVYADSKDKAFCTKMVAQMTRDTGAIMTPMNAWLTNIGTETLTLRMERHVSNAQKVAFALSKNPNIEWIKHPSLVTDKYHERAKKYMPNGVTGMMSFGVKGGREKAKKFMENLNMITMVTHVADIRTCVLCPASTTHRQLSAAELEAAGIPDNLIRLSVGIENPEDIIADLEQALARI